MPNPRARLYVGSLSYKATKEDLRELFSEYGVITDVIIIKDRETGRSKGFAFVEFADEKAAQAALVLDGLEFMERKMVINLAREKAR